MLRLQKHITLFEPTIQQFAYTLLCSYFSNTDWVQSGSFENHKVNMS
jgi:hypothetical protein